MKTKRYKVGRCTYCGEKDSVLLTEEMQNKIDSEGIPFTTHTVSVSKCGYCRKENTLKRFTELNN
jgi:hypothetical protein